MATAKSLRERVSSGPTTVSLRSKRSGAVSMDPQRARELAQNGPGSTNATEEPQGQPEAIPAPPGGPDRGTAKVYEHPSMHETVKVYAVDPGPPPRMPQEPVGVWPFGLSRLTQAAQQRNKAAVEACATMHAPPEVWRYKAELLAWLDGMDAYEKAWEEMMLAREARH